MSKLTAIIEIKVDPKDPTKCGNDLLRPCPAKINNMDCAFGIRDHAGVDERLPACLAATEMAERLVELPK
jgi:hypothetical protein